VIIMIDKMNYSAQCWLDGENVERALGQGDVYDSVRQRLRRSRPHPVTTR
jgi:hypothetical protein